MHSACHGDRKELLRLVIDGLTEAKSQQVGLGVRVSDIESVLANMTNALAAVKGDVADLSTTFKQALENSNDHVGVSIQAAGRDILDAFQVLFSAQAAELRGLVVENRDTLVDIKAHLRVERHNDRTKRLDDASIRDLVGQLLQRGAAGAMDTTREIIPAAAHVLASQEAATMLLSVGLASATGAEHAIFVVLTGAAWFATRMAQMYVRPTTPHYIIVVDFCDLDIRVSFEDARTSQVKGKP